MTSADNQNTELPKAPEVGEGEFIGRSVPFAGDVEVAKGVYRPDPPERGAAYDLFVSVVTATALQDS